MNHDSLKVKFTLRVVGNLGKPFACKNPDFSQKIQSKVGAFKDSDMMDELALRYAYNIANGRFLWRNRMASEQVEVKVSIGEDLIKPNFNAFSFSLKNFDENRDNQSLIQMANSIRDGLTQDNNYALIKVNAFVKLGEGQHVFPSQEMNAGEKKKVLFKLGKDNQAAMHNVKIGNALRTIDDWYPDAKMPIAVEPFGSVVQIGEAFRKSKIDFYTLLQDWVNDKEIEDIQKAYVVANLIRGGVFSGEKEKGEK